MLQILNQVLAFETSGDSLNDFEEYTFIRSLNDIIFNGRIPIRREYHSNMRLNQSISHSMHFLSCLNPRYADTLHFILNKGKIIYTNAKDRPIDLSSVSVIDGEKKVDFIVQGNIEDSYTLTHEVMHFDNFDITGNSINWHLMTETFSLLAESLQKRYFEVQAIPPRDYHNNEIDVLRALRIKSSLLDFEIKLIFTYLKHGYINDYLLSELLSYYSEFDANAIFEHLIDIIENRELGFHLLQRDIIGGCLSSYMLDRINNNSKYLKEFFELNDYSHEMDFIDTLKCLDLEVVDEDIVILSNKSLSDIKKSYVNRLKEMYN